MNKWKLFEIMDEKGISVQNLCAAIKMSRSAFSRKINGHSEFTLGEIKKICDYLGLDSPMGIFFVEKVS